jgi:hypothetical protein
MMASDIIVVERELLKSKAFRKLNGTSKTVYFDFLMKCKVKGIKRKQGRKTERVILNNGELEYCYTEALKKEPPIIRSTFMRSLDSLIEKGFIDIEHSGSGTRKGDKSLYTISERWRKYGTPQFVDKKRAKDTRQGRGFQKGHECYWKKQKQT